MILFTKIFKILGEQQMLLLFENILPEPPSSTHHFSKNVLIILKLAVF